MKHKIKKNSYEIYVNILYLLTAFTFLILFFFFLLLFLPHFAFFLFSSSICFSFSFSAFHFLFFVRFSVLQARRRFQSFLWCDQPSPESAAIPNIWLSPQGFGFAGCICSCDRHIDSNCSADFQSEFMTHLMRYISHTQSDWVQFCLSLYVAKQQKFHRHCQPKQSQKQIRLSTPFERSNVFYN